MLDRCKSGNSTVVIPGLGDAAATIRPLGTVSASCAAQGSDLVIRLEDVPEKSPAIAFVF